MIQIINTGSGVSPNVFGLKISGPANQVATVEASTNLAKGEWFPVQTNTLTGGSWLFGDPVRTNCAARYFRVRM